MDFDLEALLEAPLQKKEAEKKKTEDKRKRSDEEIVEDDRKKQRCEYKHNCDTDKVRSKSPSSSSSRRDKDRDRDRERRRSRSRDRDRERRRSRDRSRERDRDRDSDRHRDRDRDRDRRRSRSRDRSSRSSRRSRSRDRDRPPTKEEKRRRRDAERKKEREREALLDPAERAAIEQERDQRTVFTFNLPLRADEDDLIEFFSKAGKVRDIRLIMDRNSKRNKGFGYIEFFDKSSVAGALTLSGKPLLGQMIQVQPTYAEKNKLATTTTTITTFVPSRLYVGSLSQNVTEDEIKHAFKKFGELDFVTLNVDPVSGKSKGFAFVQYRRAEDAKRALSQGNGMEIGGRPIKIGLVNENKESGSSGSSSGGGDKRRDKHYSGGDDDLDDNEVTGVAMNALSRAALMAKLQRDSPPHAPNTPPPPSYSSGSNTNIASPMADSASPPSTCILLKNLFDPATETEPNWDIEIRDDVSDECSKFGRVLHAFVDRDSVGFMYLKFDSVNAATSAKNSLHGRWFAQRMIQAEFLSESDYERKFPESKMK